VIKPILKSDQMRRSSLKAGARIKKAVAKAEKKQRTDKVRGQISKSKDPPVVGHIIPVAQGGNSCESNLACLHDSCNAGLGARTSQSIRTLLRNTGHAIKPEPKETRK